jgi:hypothetical protein
MIQNLQGIRFDQPIINSFYQNLQALYTQHRYNVDLKLYQKKSYIFKLITFWIHVITCCMPLFIIIFVLIYELYKKNKIITTFYNYATITNFSILQIWTSCRDYFVQE